MAAFCTSCMQDCGQGASGKPRLACPILLAWLLLLLGSLAQGNTGLKVLPAWRHCCPMPWAAGQASRSCYLPLPALCPGKLGGCSAPCLPQEVHGAPLLPTLSTPGVLSRTPSTSAAQTLAQLFYGIKSTWESASPALRQSAQGTGLHAQRCPPNRLLAWLGCACAMGLFEVPSYFLSQAGLRQAETGTGSWALGQGGIATLCWRHQECRGVWGATGLLTPLAAWGTGFWWG